MKKVFLIINLLFSIVCFSQAITVNTSTYTVPELVTDILVNKPCVPVNNITWRTGTNFGSSNGIGHFTNTNPAFPLASGVILSTGNVTNAPGPNTTQLNDGIDSWSGDSDLEATLLAAGIPMVSKNATVLEFDFTPFSTNFNFQFLFASEEYGNFQCEFSDAFAFLLTNTSTGVTTNLAVVPSTTVPISVVTIRNALYNSNCLSANAGLFGTFNGGSAAAASATNFNGQTVVMNAASNSLIPNTTYHIKLVIADRKDFQADSAIFLGANSFNVGQDVLGNDLTVGTNTAICENDNYTINSGLDPTVYSFNWTFNGAPIGGNTPNLTVNQAGTYGLTYTIISSNCVVTTDFLNVEYFSAVSTPNPINLFKCNNAQPNYTFDLAINTPILNTLGTQISYHDSMVNADANTNPLPDNYNVLTSSLPATIYVRILNIASNCYIVKTFNLALTPPAVANNPGNITECEITTGSNNAEFDLAFQNNAVLGLQDSTIYNVTYYTNNTDATSGSNAIDTSIDFVTGNATVFVRVTNTTDPTCFNITSFNLIVKPLPVLDNIPNQFVCVSYTLPILVNGGNYYSGPNQGLPMLNVGDVISTDSLIYIYNQTGGTPNCASERSFRVEIVLQEDITPANEVACDSYLLPTLDYGTRYFTQPGGPTGGGVELFGGITNITTPGVNTIYTYFVSTETPPCIVTSFFTVTINITPIITGSYPNLFDCVSLNSLAPAPVGGYFTLDTLTGVYSPVVFPITTTTTIYLFATNGICRTPDTIFTVYIGSLNLPNIVECNSYNLVAPPVGEYRTAPNGGGTIIAPGLITQTTTVYHYVPGAGTPNCTDDDFFTITINGPFVTTPTPVTECASFMLPTQPEGARYFTLSGGPSIIGNVELFPTTSTITTTATIFLFKESTTQIGCFTEKPWTITINQRPIIDSRDNVQSCDTYILTPLSNGNYFDDPNGVNPLPAGTIISVNNTIYIFAANPSDPSCISQNSFTITLNGVIADPIPTKLVWCDSFTFPDLPTPRNFYYTAPRGPNGTGSIIPEGTIVNSSNVLPIYYIYYDTGDRLNCSNEKSFSITIVPTPVADAVSPITTCDTFGDNDGIYQFDLTTLAIRNDVLNGATPDSDFTLSFYTSLADANNPLATAIPNASAYQNDNPLNDSVWIRVTNNTCFDIVELPLNIILRPNPDLDPEYFICSDYETGTLLNPVVLDTRISGSNLVFAWTFNGAPIGGNTPTFLANEAGDYSVTVTNTTTTCVSTIETTKVTSYAPYLEIVYSDAFENPTFITVNVLGAGSGNYEYQIDDNPFQDSNVFNNVASGEHIISVRDKSGLCSPAPINAVIINYPKFFTPNADGFHDTWNILSLKSNNPEAPIYIFDRHGKFLKQINPSIGGWDGTFNGQPLPSTDYWFTVEFKEKGVVKTFKSHFAMKR